MAEKQAIKTPKQGLTLAVARRHFRHGDIIPEMLAEKFPAEKLEDWKESEVKVDNPIPVAETVKPIPVAETVKPIPMDETIDDVSDVFNS
jgi:hypothetical protein